MRSRPSRSVVVWVVVLLAAAVGALSVLFGTWRIPIQLAVTLLAIQLFHRLRDRPVRRLSTRGRHRFADVMRTGEASGDPIIDRLALRRLRQGAKDTPRSERTAILLGLSAAVGLEVAAAIVRSPWWAPAVLASIVTLVVVARRPVSPQHPAGERYERLLAGTSPHIH